MGGRVLSGSLVALVTPFDESGAIDYSALTRLVDWHLDAGTHGLVVLGTTGESVTLSAEEREQVACHVIKQVKGRVPVIVGSGTNATATSITQTQKAKTWGADACLLVTPYYNKPDQEGLYQHFAALAEAVDVPQVLYNVPGRTGCDLLSETVARLAQFDNIVGLKDATGDLARVTEMVEVYGDPLILLSGDDATSLDFVLQGGRGSISVTANVVPEQLSQMMERALAKNEVAAREIDDCLRSLHRDLFVSPNPVPAKWLLAEIGKIATAQVRLPLVSLAAQHHDLLRHAYQQAMGA